jgi:hypothetical protein
MPIESAKTSLQQGFSRIRGDDRDIGRLAREQHGVVSRAQLARMDLGEGAIEGRIRAGRLYRLHAGVYAVGHEAVGRQGRWMAAVLASGPAAVLSHFSAAALWGIRSNAKSRIDVTVPHRSRSSRLIYRHVSVLPTDERGVVDAIPVTTAARTILDLAAGSSVDRVERAIQQAEYLRLYDRLSLRALTERYPRRRGVARVRAALERIEVLPAGRTRSPLEDRFLPFLRRYGLPRPRLNDWIAVRGRRFQVDCHWTGTGQTVELDGWHAHGTRSAFREDRARDRALRAAGYGVTRISWAQLDDEPESIAMDLRKLLASGGSRKTP